MSCLTFNFIWTGGNSSDWNVTNGTAMTTAAYDGDESAEIWMSRMNEIQGAIIAASLFQVNLTPMCLIIYFYNLVT